MHRFLFSFRVLFYFLYCFLFKKSEFFCKYHYNTKNYDKDCPVAEKTNTAGKTCRNIGAHKKYEEKCKSDPIWLAYNRAYKNHYARVLKKKMTKSEFRTWSDWAVEYRDKALMGKVKIEEYEKKIKE